MNAQGNGGQLTGCCCVVTDFLLDARPPMAQVFERRFETAAGKQAQVDFAQFRVKLSDEPGVVRILWLFTIILGHSRWLWGRFCATQDLQTVLRCHIDAFATMDGAPSELLYDRMKTAVIGEDTNGVVQYNASLVAQLNHYGVVPRACRPYRAKTKGKIERPYRYVRQDFWLARGFRNRDDLNAQCCAAIISIIALTSSPTSRSAPPQSGQVSPGSISRRSRGGATETRGRRLTHSHL